MSTDTGGHRASGRDDEPVRDGSDRDNGSDKPVDHASEDRVVNDAGDLADPYGSEDFPERSAAPSVEPEAAVFAYADRDAQSEAEPAAGEVAAEPAPATGRRARRAARPTRQTHWWEFPVLAVVAVLVAILVKSFLVQPFYIPSQSMEKTLHGCPGCNGDKILVNKVVYRSRDPHPGEIVVFRAPDGWEPETTIAPSSNAVTGAIRSFGQLVGIVPPDEKDLVKRVIAVGGQSVKCCDSQGRVQISDNGVNGPWRSLDEPFTYLDGPDQYQVFGPLTVPKGRLWVMGDHRNDSADSRAHCGASLTQCDSVESTVPTSLVIGKAFVVAWPIGRWRTLGTPTTFTSKTGAMASSVLPLLLSTAVVVPVAGLARVRRRRRTRLRSVP